jgi:hypothetical protein
VPASLDGSALAVVRPYVVAHERERARQRHRRLALVLAADFGVDLDRHLVGASGVGGAVDTAFGAGVMTDVRKAAA